MAQTALRIRRSPETVFIHVFVVAILLGVFSLIKSRYHPSGTHDALSIVNKLSRRDEACRLVHSHRDQCTFVRENCPDEEAGLFSYLRLYFCALQHTKWLAFAILAIWVSILFSTIGLAAADFLCLNLSTMASLLGLSESLAGVTFLAFGNGSPDVFSTFAAFSSHSGSLAVGELMGAAGFITAVVAGSMAITKPFRVARKSFVRDVVLFAIAAAFSLSFLRDGKLRLWECTAMVAFYISYVIFVVAWHWYFDKRRRIKLSETAARSQHHIPDQQELDMPEVEDDEESRPTSERVPLIRTPSGGTVPTLLTPGTPAWAIDNIDDEDDETRDQYLATLASNMRVTRPGRERRNTITPIRPSLIGALEFRAVLSALEKKSTNSKPIHMRRYSDESGGALAQVAESQASISHPELVSSQNAKRSTTVPGSPARAPKRSRAVSAGDADPRTSGLLLDVPRATPETVIYSPNNESQTSRPATSDSDHEVDTQLLLPAQSERLLLSPNSISAVSTVSGASSQSSTTATRNGFLAPPDAGFHRQGFFDDLQISPGAVGPGGVSPGGVSPMGMVPKIQIPRPGQKSIPEWRYTESPAGLSPSSTRPPSFHLPPPSMSPESSHTLHLPESPTSGKRYFTWWPYQYLPAPQVLFSTLFPGLYEWSSKSWPERLVAVCTAPSIFLLTITLPVVEPKSDEEADDQEPALLTPLGDTPSRSRASTIIRLPPDSPALYGRHASEVVVPQLESSDPDDPLASSARDWNRWLAIVQCFTAPFFIVVITWANLENETNLRLLVKMILGSLAFSLITLALLLATTSPDREPKYRPVSCFLGFLVAIAWIATIANEVVGVLKAFGVILNISDAILGLTIFAVGNSLGDLVADITVARLGFPMMALSACFGGPMLNILLGIGIGGLYQTLTNAQHKHNKHPTRPIKYHPYELDVNMTLMISGITLLITLVFLLIVVPWNNWRMDRKVGVGLISIWAVSTIVNVILEIVGIGQEKLEHYFPST